MHTKPKKKLKNFLTALSLFLPLSLGIPVDAETVFLKGTAYQSGISEKELKVGSSEVIVANLPIKRVAVTDPSVADIRILSETTALVRSKRVGRTSLLIWEGKDASVRPTRFDLTVKRDISDLIARIKLIDPNIDVEYIIVPSDRIEPAQPTNSNGAYTTSFRTAAETVGDPAPSVVVNNAQGGGAGATGASSSGGKGIEKLILTGRVKNGDAIIRAITIASTYMGEDGSIKVVTRTGGLVADQAGSVLGSSSGGSDEVLASNSSFRANLQSNVINGNIVSNGSGSVISFLQIADKPQVAVKVRFYEVTRTIGKSLKAQIFKNFNNGAQVAINGPTPSVAGQKLGTVTFPDPRNPERILYNLGRIIESAGQGGGVPLGTGGNFVMFPKWDLEFVLEALERRGEAKILAEPTIVSISGEVGEFRAGGEIPVAQARAALGAVVQSFQYIPYGIGITILPTVTDSDSILMNLKAITRDLDTALGQPGSPAFKTRKVDTQVEMDPSQALVLAGLINSTSSRELGKIPLIGDIPVLGTLFRSKDFQRGNTELVIVLSPEIVRAGHPSQVVKPLATDHTNDRQFDWIPTSIQANRTSIPVTAPPMGIPQNGPVDLSRPTVTNDLDRLYH